MAEPGFRTSVVTDKTLNFPLFSTDIKPVSYVAISLILRLGFSDPKNETDLISNSKSSKIPGKTCTLNSIFSPLGSKFLPVSIKTNLGLPEYAKHAGLL